MKEKKVTLLVLSCSVLLLLLFLFTLMGGMAPASGQARSVKSSHTAANRPLLTRSFPLAPGNQSSSPGVAPKGVPPRKSFAQEFQKTFLWSGAVLLKVEDFEKGRLAVSALTTEFGGTLFDEKTEVTGNGRRHGFIRLRIPTSSRQQFLQKIQAVGTLHGLQIISPDVTPEVIDLDRRLRNLQAEEGQLLEVMKRARNISEILQVQYHLYGVRMESERVATRSNELAVRSQEGSMVVTLFEPRISQYEVVPAGWKGYIPRWWRAEGAPQIKRAVMGAWNISCAAAIGKAQHTILSLPSFLAWLLMTLLFGIWYRSRIWPGVKEDLQERFAAGIELLEKHGVKPEEIRAIFWSGVLLFLLCRVIPGLFSFVLLAGSVAALAVAVVVAMRKRKEIEAREEDPD